MLAYAFVCDITRVASVLFTGGAAETRFDDLGHLDVHHNNSHGTNQFFQDLVDEGVIYIMQNFAQMLETFQATEDIDGTNLLDTSAIYCSSDCSIGWSHSVDRQPIIIAGHARNALVHPGIHYQAVPPDPDYHNSAGNMTDVLLTLAQIFDPTIESIGSGQPMSSTPFEPIKAG